MMARDQMNGSHWLRGSAAQVNTKREVLSLPMSHTGYIGSVPASGAAYNRAEESSLIVGYESTTQRAQFR